MSLFIAPQEHVRHKHVSYNTIQHSRIEMEWKMITEFLSLLNFQHEHTVPGSVHGGHAVEDLPNVLWTRGGLGLCVSVQQRNGNNLTISWKTMESFWRIVTWWLCLLFWTHLAAVSLVFSLLQSGLSTHYTSYQGLTDYLTNSLGSFLYEAACKKKFRMCSNETHLVHNALPLE